MNRDDVRFYKIFGGSILVAFAILVLIFSCAPAKAGAFVEAGQSTYQRPPDGIWWQSAYPYTEDRKSTYFRIGAESSGGYRVSYFDLGSYWMNAEATQDEDDLQVGKCNAKTCYPPDRYVSKGSIHGLSLSKVFRGDVFFLEVGATYSRQTFEVAISAITNKNKYSHHPGNVHRIDGANRGLGTMIGFGANYGNIYVAFTGYLPGDRVKNFRDNTPSGQDLIKTVSIGWRF